MRLGPVNRHLLMGFEEDLMNAEVYVCSICAETGIPCSEILACDTSKTIVDRDIMIVKYIPSVAMSNADLQDFEKDSISHRLGEYLARLHGVEGKSFGFVSCMQKKYDI